MRFNTRVVAVALLVLTGCAARRGSTSFRTAVNPNCLTAPIVMKGCDLSKEPAHCRSVELRYRADCAEIDANQTRK